MHLSSDKGKHIINTSRTRGKKIKFYRTDISRTLFKEAKNRGQLKQILQHSKECWIKASKSLLSIFSSGRCRIHIPYLYSCTRLQIPNHNNILMQHNTKFAEDQIESKYRTVHITFYKMSEIATPLLPFCFKPHSEVMVYSQSTFPYLS